MGGKIIIWDSNCPLRTKSCSGHRKQPASEKTRR